MPELPTVAALLREAAETHHRVYRITDGTDDDWASWYADWLLERSELPALSGQRPVRSHLVHALVQLDRDYTVAEINEPWPEYYSQGLRRFFPHPLTGAPITRAATQNLHHRSGFSIG